MVKLVVDSGYTGFYFRVLAEGITEKGTLLKLQERDTKISVSFANHIYYHDRKNHEGIEKVLAVSALSEAWRKSFQELEAACG
jgi:MOSC domain-containing protein YiiM